MIVETTEKVKLLIASRKLISDNKKDISGNWIPTGTQSMMYSGTFVTEFGDEIRLSSKEDMFQKYLNQEVHLQFKVEQFGMKSPSCKIYAVVPVKK